MKHGFILPGGYLISSFLLTFCVSCATKAPLPAPEAPVPQPEPRCRLVFDRMLAADPGHISLYFNLEAENPRNTGALLELRDWRIRINGTDPGRSGIFAEDFAGNVVAAGASARFPVRLDLDLAAIRESVSGGGDFDEYRTELSLDLGFNFGAEGGAELRVTGTAAFPRIHEPRFTITEIAVKKAELINTRFKVKLRIENLNMFPLELSAFRYTLYGDGSFWADGTEKNILSIPPKGSAETELLLVMNFINMRRELLDQIIAKRQVRYRFTGESTVSTGLDYVPPFRTRFDRSGYSEVIE
jgi:LEA14-like dessication related protein